jgi:hypothetical protein
MHTVVGKLDLKTSLTHKTAEEWKRQDHLRVKSEKRTGLRKDPVAEAVARVERGYPVPSQVFLSVNQPPR